MLFAIWCPGSRILGGRNALCDLVPGSVQIQRMRKTCNPCSLDFSEQLACPANQFSHLRPALFGRLRVGAMLERVFVALLCLGLFPQNARNDEAHGDPRFHARKSPLN